MFIQKYINLYYNKGIAKCVANAIQISPKSQMLLDVNRKSRHALLVCTMIKVGVRYER